MIIPAPDVQLMPMHEFVAGALIAPRRVAAAWGMNRRGQAMGGAIFPEIMRWLWRDHPVSTDPRDTTERSLHSPAARN